jgi:uncharacterized protein YndB with AHSA1/START domain
MTTPRSTEGTRIDADPDLPIIRTTRAFAAPPAAVYRAHVEPDLVVRWLGPSRLRTVIERWDARTGGSWAYTSHGEPGERYGFFGSFHELRPGALLVQTFTWDGRPDDVVLDRVVLEDVGGSGTLLHGSSLFDSFAGRDAMLADGMEQGVVEGYQRLDDLLATR